jgi:hypothetical protein
MCLLEEAKTFAVESGATRQLANACAHAILRPTARRWLLAPSRLGSASVGGLPPTGSRGASDCPIAGQILEQPGWSFNRQHTRLAEPGFGQFALQLIRPVQVRGGEEHVFGATVLTVGQILPRDRGVTRVREEVPDQPVESGGKS